MFFHMNDAAMSVSDILITAIMINGTMYFIL
jgi:hypothetical protein